MQRTEETNRVEKLDKFKKILDESPDVFVQDSIIKLINPANGQVKLYNLFTSPNIKRTKLKAALFPSSDESSSESSNSTTPFSSSSKRSSFKRASFKLSDNKSQFEDRSSDDSSTTSDSNDSDYSIDYQDSKRTKRKRAITTRSSKSSTRYLATNRAGGAIKKSNTRQESESIDESEVDEELVIPKRRIIENIGQHKSAKLKKIRSSLDHIASSLDQRTSNLPMRSKPSNVDGKIKSSKKTNPAKPSLSDKTNKKLNEKSIKSVEKEAKSSNIDKKKDSTPDGSSCPNETEHNVNRKDENDKISDSIFNLMEKQLEEAHFGNL